MSARRIAFDVLRQVTGEGAYANLALNKNLSRAQLGARDAGFVTELVSGTCRMMGTYDAIIEQASGRKLTTLQPAVVDLLRLGAHQALSMNVPIRAAVGTTVELARSTVGNRVTGVVNAILRKVSAASLEQWTRQLSEGAAELERLAIIHHHPSWIARAYAQVLPIDEVGPALAANNVVPAPTLVIRPGLAQRDELLVGDAKPTRYSPFGAETLTPPGNIPLIKQHQAGVQDEGSQLMAWLLSRVEAPEGPWLDICAGPGGKAALLAGLALEHQQWLVASESHPHRAALVSQALVGYQPPVPVVCADGTRPAWKPGVFARVLADVPCSGLGALRRRPEARWRKTEQEITDLSGLQRKLLHSALDATMTGGVVAYVTCSPHRAETREVVEAVVETRSDLELLTASEYLPEVPHAQLDDFVQLWPHRHHTDAMFGALIRRTIATQHTTL